MRTECTAVEREMLRKHDPLNGLANDWFSTHTYEARNKKGMIVDCGSK